MIISTEYFQKLSDDAKILAKLMKPEWEQRFLDFAYAAEALTGCPSLLEDAEEAGRLVL